MDASPVCQRSSLIIGRGWRAEGSLCLGNSVKLP